MTSGYRFLIALLNLLRSLHWLQRPWDRFRLRKIRIWCQKPFNMRKACTTGTTLTCASQSCPGTESVSTRCYDFSGAGIAARKQKALPPKASLGVGLDRGTMSGASNRHKVTQVKLRRFRGGTYQHILRPSLHLWFGSLLSSLPFHGPQWMPWRVLWMWSCCWLGKVSRHANSSSRTTACLGMLTCNANGLPGFDWRHRPENSDA